MYVYIYKYKNLCTEGVLDGGHGKEPKVHSAVLVGDGAALLVRLVVVEER